MRGRNPNVADETVGHDSFLDIFANLVGILVILIMVLGVRAKDAWVVQLAEPKDQVVAEDLPERAPEVADTTIETPFETQPSEVTSSPPVSAPPPLAASQDQVAQAETDATISLTPTMTATPPPPLPSPPLPDLQALQETAGSLAQDAQQFEAEIAQIRDEAELQQLRRDELLLAISLLEKQIASHEAQEKATPVTTEPEALPDSAPHVEPDLSAKKLAEVQRQLADKQAELANVQQELSQIGPVVTAPTVIEHRPTPLAKTVFGSEEHFRLLGGRLTYVPLNTLVQQMKTDVENKTDLLMKAPETTEIIGPVGGYRLRYTVRVAKTPIKTDNGTVLREVMGLRSFSCIPVGDLVGMTVEEALQVGSPFQRQLAQFSATSTTITIWTYPDSFSQFRVLQAALQKQGLVVAGRPLPRGALISGSPQGSHTVAQ